MIGDQAITEIVLTTLAVRRGKIKGLYRKGAAERIIARAKAARFCGTSSDLRRDRASAARRRASAAA